MKTIIAFCSFLVSLIYTPLFGGIPHSTKKTSIIDKNKTGDTTKIVYISKKPILNQISEYPANQIYTNWDTSIIHPIYNDNYFTSDSIVLRLAENDDYFTMPWKGTVTSSFGWRHGRPHQGTDIDLETGDTIVAAFNGKVRLARVAGGYGNCVIIRHPNGLETLYGHLSKIMVKTGDEICSGQVIGLGGNTGHSFGSHLHFEIRYLGKSINTERFIDYNNWSLKRNDFKLYKSDFIMNKPVFVHATKINQHKIKFSRKNQKFSTKFSTKNTKKSAKIQSSHYNKSVKSQTKKFNKIVHSSGKISKKKIQVSAVSTRKKNQKRI